MDAEADSPRWLTVQNANQPIATGPWELDLAADREDGPLVAPFGNTNGPPNLELATELYEWIASVFVFDADFEHDSPVRLRPRNQEADAQGAVHPELARRPRRIVRQVWNTEPRYRVNMAGRAADASDDRSRSWWLDVDLLHHGGCPYSRTMAGDHWLGRRAAWDPLVQEAAVSKQQRPQTEEELAAELLEHRNDKGEWGEEAVPIKRRPSRTEVVSVRIPTTDLDLMEELAGQAGESISDCIRGAIALRLHGQVMDPVLGFASGAGSDLTVLVRTILKAAGYTAQPSHEESQLDIEVPDEPPGTVSIMR
jgi:hypothetical protein